jgi:hypothetical protein
MALEFTRNPFTAELDAIDVASLTGYVPYTGATTNVNLGIRTLTTSGTVYPGAIDSTGEVKGGSGKFSFFTLSTNTITNSFGGNTMTFNSGNIQSDAAFKAVTYIFEKGTYDLTLASEAITISAKTITFPNATGTVALTSDLSAYLKLDQTTPQTTVGTFTFPQIKDSGLTINRVPYVSTAGLLVDNSGFTFTGSTLVAPIIRATTGIYDNAGTPILSIDSGSRWLYDTTPKISLNWNDRQLYDSTGLAIMFDWSTAGTAQFGTQNIITKGTGTFGETNDKTVILGGDTWAIDTVRGARIGGGLDLQSGELTNVGTIGAGAITGTSLTDGTATLNNGSITGGVDATFSGTGTLGSLSVTNGAVINEAGGDYDFRVEGDTKTHLLFTDASTDRVGINSSTPGYNLDMVNDDAADAGIAVRASTYVNIPYPGSLTNLALLSPRGFNFCTDGYTLAVTFQPSLGIGLAGNRGPMLGIKASATGAAIAIEQGRIGVGTSGPQEPIDCIGNILTRSTSGTIYETRTRMVSTYYGGASNYASGGIEIDGVQAAVGYGLYGATRFYAGANTDATRGWAWKADGLLLTTTLALSTGQMVLNKAGNLGIGTVAPTAVLHLKAGTATAGTAPIKLTTGNYNTNPEAGTFEWYATTAENPTFTPVSTRYRIPLIDSGVGGLTSGRVPFATTNGRLTDDADMTFATDTLTVTKIKSSHYCADGTAPLANGTYTIFDGSYTGAVDGTITIKDGLITAYQTGGAPLP